MKMARGIQTSLVLLLLAIAVSAQGPWKRHYSSDEEYSVEFPPGEPTRGSRRLEDAGSNAIFLRSMAMTSGEMRFIASHYDIPSGAAFSFSRTRDGIISKLNGKLISESSTKTAGMSTRWFKLHAKTAQGHEIVVSVHLMSDMNRVYLLQAIFPRSLENTPAEGNARSFFNSFTKKN